MVLCIMGSFRIIYAMGMVLLRIRTMMSMLGIGRIMIPLKVSIDIQMGICFLVGIKLKI